MIAPAAVQLRLALPDARLPVDATALPERFGCVARSARSYALLNARIERLERVYVARMRWDDVLVFNSNWRLKFLYLESGWPHFRLSYRGRVVGIVDVRGESERARVNRMLAVYMVCLGVTPERCHVIRSGARTPTNATKKGLPRLFAAA